MSSSKRKRQEEDDATCPEKPSNPQSEGIESLQTFMTQYTEMTQENVRLKQELAERNEKIVRYAERLDRTGYTAEIIEEFTEFILKRGLLAGRTSHPSLILRVLAQFVRWFFLDSYSD